MLVLLESAEIFCLEHDVIYVIEAIHSLQLLIALERRTNLSLDEVWMSERWKDKHLFARFLRSR